MFTKINNQKFTLKDKKRYIKSLYRFYKVFKTKNKNLNNEKHSILKFGTMTEIIVNDNHSNE